MNKTFPEKCPACGHEDRTREEHDFIQHGEGELSSVHMTGPFKKVLRWYHEGSATIPPAMVGCCTRCGIHPWIAETEEQIRELRKWLTAILPLTMDYKPDTIGADIITRAKAYLDKTWNSKNNDYEYHPNSPAQER